MTDRARLLAGTAKLDEGTRRLEESQRIAMETEQTGADILLNLRGQREQIEHARDTVGAGGISLCWPRELTFYLVGHCGAAHRPCVRDAEGHDSQVSGGSSVSIFRTSSSIPPGECLFVFAYLA